MSSMMRMLLGNFITVTGCMLFLVLPAYLEHSGLSRSTIGLADGCFWAVSVLIQPLLGPRLDRFGPKWFMVVGVSLMTLVATLFYLAPLHPIGVLAMRATQGAGFAVYLTSGWSWVAGNALPARKGEFLGYFGVSSLMAGIAGPVIAELIGKDYHRAFLGAAIFLSLGALLLLTLPNDTKSKSHESHVSGNFLGLLLQPNMRSMAWGSLGFGLAVGSLFAFSAAYMTSLKMAGFSVVFGLITLASGAARIWTARHMDRLGAVSFILPSLLLLAFGVLGLSSLAHVSGVTMPILIVSGTAAGLGYGAVYPALNGLAVERLPESSRGVGLALVAASIDLGNAVGATAAGIVAERLSYSTMYSIIGCLVLFAAGMFKISEFRGQAKRGVADD
jgi:MFS family permease